MALKLLQHVVGDCWYWPQVTIIHNFIRAGCKFPIENIFWQCVNFKLHTTVNFTNQFYISYNNFSQFFSILFKNSSLFSFHNLFIILLKANFLPFRSFLCIGKKIHWRREANMNLHERMKWNNGCNSECRLIPPENK